jgi:hypothetical protein
VISSDVAEEKSNFFSQVTLPAGWKALAKSKPIGSIGWIMIWRHIITDFRDPTAEGHYFTKELRSLSNTRFRNLLVPAEFRAIFQEIDPNRKTRAEDVQCQEVSNRLVNRSFDL